MRSQTLNIKVPSGFQDAAGLTVSPDLVWKEHDAELARDDVELSILKRQSQRVGLLPPDAIRPGLLRRGLIEHRLIEIGRHDASALGKARSDGARKDAGAGSRLQQVLRLGAGDPVGEIARVGFEDQRDEEPLVKRGNRPRE